MVLGGNTEFGIKDYPLYISGSLIDVQMMAQSGPQHTPRHTPVPAPPWSSSMSCCWAELSLSYLLWHHDTHFQVILSEFSKWQLKQRRGTVVYSILPWSKSNAGQRPQTEKTHSTMQPRMQRSENVAQSEPHCCSRDAASRPEHLFQHLSLLRGTGCFFQKALGPLNL